ncbi:late competence development ComFB family protein [Oscillospiraceae bacterium 21-37]|jgi:hypothetical protein
MPKATGKSGRGGKSSKTAHVLNLLTETDHTQEEGAAGRTPPAAPPAPPQLADNETVAATIRDALEEDLAAELGESPAEALPEEDFIPMQDFAPAVEPEATVDATPLEEAPAPAPEPEPQPEPVPEPEPEPEPVLEQAQEPAPMPAPEPEPEPVAEMEPEPAPEPEAVPEPEPAPAAEAKEEVPEEDRPITCLNVMQELVEEKVDKYMKMFGLCTCPRCRVDVVALTLTSLPAKYVVVRENEATPMLTVYEGRYNTAVIAQIMWACKKVLDNPRH